MLSRQLKLLSLSAVAFIAVGASPAMARHHHHRHHHHHPMHYKGCPRSNPNCHVNDPHPGVTPGH